MDTTTLEAAYRDLLAVARTGGFRPPADSAGWPAELRLAQVAATDRLLAAATAEVLAGAQARYDHRPATRTDYLSEIGRAAGGFDGLVETVRRCGLELVLLARRLGDREAATPVPTRIFESGTGDAAAVRVDGPLPWAGVLNTHAEVHLPEHAAALQALRR